MARKTTPEKIDADVGDALEKALADKLSETDINLDLSIEDLETQISKATKELQAEHKDAAMPQAANAGTGQKPSAAAARPQSLSPAIDIAAAAQKPVQRPVIREPLAGTPVPRPANDDSLRDHARSLRNLNRRLPRTIYWLTGLLSLGWLAGGGALAYSFYGAAIINLSLLQRFIATPTGATLIAGLVFPVILFWAFAILVRRSQELRIAAQTMAEAAFRLVEPETVGQERVMTVGQAVRREVAAMSEGIERTLARAAELETLVHSEVTEIERAYTDNEVRIRSLVEELGHERDSIISHADRVRASISSAHELLRDELSAASDLIHNNVMNTSTQLTMAINQSGESLVERINQSGGAIHGAIDTRSDDIAARMSTSGEAFATLVDGRIAKLNDQAEFLTRALAGTFDSREQAIVGLFNSATQTFSDRIGERSDLIISQLGGVTANLNDVLHGGANEVLALVNSSTENLTGEINSRISTLENAVVTRGKALISEFETRAQALDNGTERLNAALDTRARMINETLLERSKDISRTFADGQEKSLALLAETRVGIQGSLIEQTEELRKVLEERITDITRTVSDGHESTQQLLSNTQSALKSGLGAFSSDLGSMLDARRATFEVSVNNARDVIQTDLSRVEEMLSGTSAGISSNLNAFTSTFDSVYETRRSVFETSLSGARAGLEADISRAEDILRGASDDLRETIGGFSDDLGSVIEAKRSALERSLDSAQGRLIADLSRTEALFDDAGNALGDKVEMFAGKVSNLLEARQDSFDKSFADAKANLEIDLSRTENLLTRTSDDLQSGFAAFNGGLGQLLEDKESSFNASLGAARDSIEANLARTEEIIRRAKDGLSENFSGFTDNLDQVIESRRVSLFGTLDEARRSFTSAITDDLDRISASRIDMENVLRSEIEKIELAFGDQTGAIEERTTTMRRALEMGVEAVRKALEQSAGTVAVTLRDKVREAADDLSAEASRASGIIEQQSADFVARIDSRLADTEEKLGARAQALSGAFDAQDERIMLRTAQSARTLQDHAEGILSALGQVDERLGNRAADAAQSFAGHSEGVISALDEADQRIMARVHQVSSELDARASDVERRLASSVASSVGSLSMLNERISEQADSAALAFEQRTASLTNMLDDRASDVERRLASSVASSVGSLSTLNERITEQADNAAQAFEQRTASLTSMLDERANDAERRLASSVASSVGSLASLNERIAEQVDSAALSFDQRTASLSTMLDDRTRELSRFMEETALPIVDRMAESGISAAAQLEEATKAASERLRRENAALVQALASRTSETLAAMESARNELDTGVTDLIDRLSASNMNLGQLIELATRNLGSVDQRIAESSASLAANSATLSEQAEKATGSIATTNRLLETNVHRLTDISSQTLKEVASIASRFDEHGRVLASASDLLNAAQASLSTTLEDRQASLENLAIGLVKKSEEIESTLRSFETLVTSAFERVETRSVDSSEKIRATVSEVVDQAAGRFAEATEEMRRTAGSIRTELEATRNELKRGVMELPEETRESTSKMRRAVSEQINALKELSDIVAKTGRMYDAAPAASEQRIASLPVAPTMRPIAPLPSQAPAPALRGTIDAGALTQPRPAPQPAPAREPAAAKQAGWVSDLLRRASTEEETPKPAEARPPLHVVESLNSLSVDIARAIDHNASVELWDRYRRGERNVFTRRLYTIKGQQTFDEIRRKYQTDSEFRTAVDRYVADFEKLLEDVAVSDRDSIMTQTYLTSDTGKVYTMLAHASGRIR